jgi:predicted unusual protein kinase regulating ubiquinone biosynthesis (AarF/ABC1/UbiB family)
MTETAHSDPSDVEGQLLGRATQIGRVLAKYGLQDRRQKGAEDMNDAERARRLRDALEELGPTFAKLGQILSTRPDLLPPEVIAELATLQERVTPLTEAEVVAVMEEELRVPWEDVFASIEPAPMAAGTIGQVHRARLEGGDRVVVKVQRPNAATDIYRDLGLLEMFAAKTADRPTFRRLVDIPAVIEHLSSSLKRELDFRMEASNIDRMREVLASYSRLEVPHVYGELSSARLLIMQEVEGVPVREAPVGEARTDAARQLLDSYYEQILTVGFFHADPHPGNLKWWDEKIYFLDFGMVGEVDPATREHLLLLLMAFWREDVPFLTDVLLIMSGDDRRADLDVARIETEIGALVRTFRHSSLKEIQLGPVLQGITEVAARNDMRLPASMALTGKALAQVQLTVGGLDAKLDPFAVAGNYLLRRLGGRLRDRADPQRLVYDVEKARVRLSRLAEAIERLAGTRPGQRFQVQFSGTEKLEATIRNAARRVALGILAGTCIIATGVTADSKAVGTWVPLTLGIVGAILAVGLVVDLLRSRHH